MLENYKDIYHGFPDSEKDPTVYKCPKCYKKTMHKKSEIYPLGKKIISYCTNCDYEYVDDDFR